MLRALAGCAAFVGLFNALYETVWLLYLTREFNLNPGILGMAFAIGAIGFLLGALLSERTTRWIGLGPTIIGSVALIGVSDLIVPLASGPMVILVIVVIVSQFLFGIGFTGYMVGQVQQAGC